MASPRPVRFLQTGDWQLGMTRHFLSEDAQARFAQARIDAVRALGVAARERDCEFMLVCGDVFESNRVDRRTVTRALDALAEVEVPVYLLPGNHDPLEPGSVYRSPTFEARCPPHVSVLDSERPLELRPGVELVAAPWRSKRPEADTVARACAGLAARERGTPLRIVAAHGGIDVLAPQRRDASMIALAAAEAALREAVDFIALGDRHSLLAVGASGRIHYAGTPEPTDFDEERPGFALAVELDSERALVEPVQVGRWSFVRREAELRGADDLRTLARWLEAQPAKERSVVELVLRGTLGVAERAELDTVLAAERDRFAALRESSQSQLAISSGERDLDELPLEGYGRRALERLRALALQGQAKRAASGASEDQTAAEAARDALALLYRLSARPS
jgi:DNA repair exonuclease SbcCD nuclease subunit